MALEIEVCWVNIESDIAKSLMSLWAEGFTIVNAPRPISGDKAWEGDWLKGCHYAAGATDRFHKHWADYGAREIRSVTNGLIKELLREKAKSHPLRQDFDTYLVKYGDRGIKDLAASWLDMPYWVGDRGH